MDKEIWKAPAKGKTVKTLDKAKHNGRWYRVYAYCDSRDIITKFIKERGRPIATVQFE